MDRVYSVAIATIAAASKTDPSRGLTCLRSRVTPQVRCFVRGICYIANGPSLQSLIDDTLWNSRGWTYQEFMLSRRLIVFTSDQVFFSCAVGTRAEDTIYSISDQIIKDWSGNTHHLYQRIMPADFHAGSGWEMYNTAVNDYTKRNLTCISDRLPAISGVLRSLGRYCDDIFLCGLPAKLFPYCLLWHSTGSSRRLDGSPSWSWVGWTGHTWNPARRAVSTQWERGPRIIVSELEDLRFRSAKGDELFINQTPSDDELMNWLNTPWIMSLEGIQPIDQAASSLDGTDETFGHLLFQAESGLLSIEPERNSHTNELSDPNLRRYRILHYDNWIGTVFLTLDCAASYPTVTHDCEFIRITNCAVNTDKIWFNLLDDFDVKMDEPNIFDPSYYKFAEHLHPGMPKPPKIYLSHVMLLERRGGSVYRKAVGLIVQDQAKWTWGDFCLE